MTCALAFKQMALAHFFARYTQRVGGMQRDSQSATLQDLDWDLTQSWCVPERFFLPLTLRSSLSTRSQFKYPLLHVWPLSPKSPLRPSPNNPLLSLLSTPQPTPDDGTVSIFIRTKPTNFDYEDCSTHLAQWLLIVFEHNNILVPNEYRIPEAELDDLKKKVKEMNKNENKKRKREEEHDPHEHDGDDDKDRGDEDDELESFEIAFLSKFKAAKGFSEYIQHSYGQDPPVRCTMAGVPGDAVVIHQYLWGDNYSWFELRFDERKARSSNAVRMAIYQMRNRELLPGSSSYNYDELQELQDIWYTVEFQHAKVQDAHPQLPKNLDYDAIEELPHVPADFRLDITVGDGPTQALVRLGEASDAVQMPDSESSWVLPPVVGLGVLFELRRRSDNILVGKALCGFKNTGARFVLSLVHAADT